MDTATLLDQTLRAQGIPIAGVSIGTLADRATWKVQYDASATAQQKTDGAALVATFDPAAPAVVTAQQDREAMGDVDQKVLRAVSQALWEAIPAPTVTKVQLRARAIAIWKTL
jgi:hypothetical protein